MKSNIAENNINGNVAEKWRYERQYRRNGNESNVISNRNQYAISKGMYQ